MRLLTILTITAALLPAADFKLPAGCKLPASLNPKDSFSQCGNDGSGVNFSPIQDAAKVREDQAKNTFCADMSHPVNVDFQVLRDMQAAIAKKAQDNAAAATKKTAAKKSTPQQAMKALLSTSRDPLKGFFNLKGQMIGEGTVVRIVALIKDAHVSDCRDGSQGEDVNCKVFGVQSNDFHIPLLDPTVPNAAAQSECASVTAEISPHFRPDAWRQFDLKTPTKNLVRITGPLFLDDSHELCAPGATTGPGPERSSLWEVHPVYQVEVCSSSHPAECDINSTAAAVWSPYSTWITSHAADATASGKKQNEACMAAKTP